MPKPPQLTMESALHQRCPVIPSATEEPDPANINLWCLAHGVTWTAPVVEAPSREIDLDRVARLIGAHDVTAAVRFSSDSGRPYVSFGPVVGPKDGPDGRAFCLGPGQIRSAIGGQHAIADTAFLWLGPYDGSDADTRLWGWWDESDVAHFAAGYATRQPSASHRRPPTPTPTPDDAFCTACGFGWPQPTLGQRLHDVLQSTSLDELLDGHDLPTQQGRWAWLRSGFPRRSRS